MHRGVLLAVPEASVNDLAAVPVHSAVMYVGGGGWRGDPDGDDPPLGVRGRERKIRLGETGDLQPEAHHALVAPEFVRGGECPVRGYVWDPLDLAEAWNADDPEI
jgi:hypothetical protein